VIIERLAPLPSKPQNVIIERWLPYNQVKRRVIFNKAVGADSVIATPRNVIVQWEAPDVLIKKEIKYLGVIRANPVEYVQKYGASLKIANQLPQFVLDIKTPDEVGVLAADYKYNSVYELEGQLEGLKYVDLEKEGLGEYRAQLNRLGFGSAMTSSTVGSAVSSGSVYGSGSASGFASGSASALVSQIFSQMDRDGSGTLSVNEAESIFLRINSRLGRSYGENEVALFFRTLDRNGDGVINLNEFRAAFDRLL